MAFGVLNGPANQHLPQCLHVLGYRSRVLMTNLASTVFNIAALRAQNWTANITPGQSLLLQGYYASQDQGGGPLYHDEADETSVDNGGTIFVDAVGRRWKRPQ